MGIKNIKIVKLLLNGKLVKLSLSGLFALSMMTGCGPKSTYRMTAHNKTTDTSPDTTTEETKENKNSASSHGGDAPIEKQTDPRSLIPHIYQGQDYSKELSVHLMKDETSGEISIVDKDGKTVYSTYTDYTFVSPSTTVLTRQGSDDVAVKSGAVLDQKTGKIDTYSTGIQVMGNYLITKDARVYKTQLDESGKAIAVTDQKGEPLSKNLYEDVYTDPTTGMVYLSKTRSSDMLDTKTGAVGHLNFRVTDAANGYVIIKSTEEYPINYMVGRVPSVGSEFQLLSEKDSQEILFAHHEVGIPQTLIYIKKNESNQRVHVLCNMGGQPLSKGYTKILPSTTQTGKLIVTEGQKNMGIIDANGAELLAPTEIQLKEIAGNYASYQKDLKRYLIGVNGSFVSNEAFYDLYVDQDHFVGITDDKNIVVYTPGLEELYRGPGSKRDASGKYNAWVEANQSLGNKK